MAAIFQNLPLRHRRNEKTLIGGKCTIAQPIRLQLFHWYTCRILLKCLTSRHVLVCVTAARVSKSPVQSFRYRTIPAVLSVCDAGYARSCVQFQAGLKLQLEMLKICPTWCKEKELDFLYTTPNYQIPTHNHCLWTIQMVQKCIQST